MNERDIARLDGIEGGREVASGEPLHHHRRCRAIIDLVRQWHQRAGGREDLLGVAARHVDPSDPLTRHQPLNVIAHSYHPTRALDAERLGVRYLRPRRAASHANVHEIDARYDHLDQDLPWTRRPQRAVCHGEDVHIARPIHHNCLHVFSNIERAFLNCAKKGLAERPQRHAGQAGEHRSIRAAPARNTYPGNASDHEPRCRVRVQIVRDVVVTLPLPEALGEIAEQTVGCHIVELRQVRMRAAELAY